MTRRPEDSDVGGSSVMLADGEGPRQLTPEAERALKEAAERRELREAKAAKAKVEAELGGRTGPDPVRYGDWENGGIASDF